MRTLACMVLVSLHVAASAEVIGVAPSSAVVYGGSSEVLLFSGATVSNLSDVPQYVRCTRVEVDVVPGSENAFAWMSSMPPGAATDPNPRMIIELGSSNDLQGVYFPNGAEGTSVIRYCFYTELDMSDSACIDVSYIAVGTGIGESPGPRLWMRHDPGNDLLLFGGDPVGPID